MNKNEIKEAVREAFKEELKDFYIDREEHYKQHKCLGKLIELTENTASSAWKSIVCSIIMATIGLTVMGFIYWIGGKIKL